MRIVDALVERSLLVPEATPEGPWLRFFNSVRRYALERLAEAGGEPAARAAHLHGLRLRFERADAEQFHTPLHRWLPQLGAELDTCARRCASAWRSRRRPLRARMRCACCAPAACSGPLAARQVQPDWNIVARRQLLQLQASVLRDRGDLEGYREACAALLAECRAEGAEYECWPVANALGQALVQPGNLEEAGQILAATAADVWACGMQREQVPLLAVNASVQLLRGTDASALQASREAAALLQAWADAQVDARGETRGSLFSVISSAFATAAATPIGAAGRQAAPLSDAAAATLAFGQRDCAAAC